MQQESNSTASLSRGEYSIQVDEDKQEQVQGWKNWKIIKFFKGKKQDENAPKLYKMRWVLLLIYTLAMFSTVLAQSTFSSIGTIIMQYYNIPHQNWKLNMFNMIFLIFQLPSSWIVGFIMKRFGLRWCMIIYGCLTFTGMWIRCFGYKKGDETFLWVAFSGQTFIAIAQQFITGTSGLMGVNWFGDKERTLVQVVTLLMGVIGGGVAFAIGPSLITMGKTEMDGSEVGMAIYLIGQALVASLCLVLIVSFVKDRPPTPPVLIKGNAIEGKDDENESQESINNESNDEESGVIQNSDSNEIYPEQTFWEGFKKLITSMPFIMLTISNSCLTSVFQTFAILDQIIAPKGYTTFDNANLNMVHIVFVLIGCFGLSILFDKTKRFKLISSLSSLVACIGFACFAVILQWEKTEFLMILVYLSIVVVGSSAIPSLPLISQMVVYATYPVHPATCLVVSSVFTTVWSIIMWVIVNILLSQVKDSSNIILWMNLGLLILSFLMVALFRGNFNNVLVKK